MAPRIDRRLAAVMAVDVVGYSRLVGLDEAGTLARVKAHRVELAEPLIVEHHGRVVKLTGDGALVEFASAVDAVECALAIQHGMAEREAAETEERRIRFRIGINIGDIVLEDGDIFGDGVNVAARLEALADPGGICIARNVYNQVKAKLNLGFEPMGAHQVKNIAEPVEVYRVLPEPGMAAAAGLKRAGTPKWRWAALAAAAAAVVFTSGAVEWWSWSNLASQEEVGEHVEAGSAEAKPALPLPDKPSIAVLPFDNLSGEERYERLADGITEDIITDLSRFRELFVIARNSTFVYKDKPADVRQVARELGVQYVLEGSLQAEGDRVRITAQLIDATTGNHEWSDRYDRPLDDLFAIQDEVTESIAGELGGFHGAVARSKRELARRKSPANLDAYEYYLMGVEHKHKYTKEDNKKAQELLKRAIEADPNLARAYVVLGLSYNLEVDYGWNETYQDAMRKWRIAIDKAIELDPYDSEAHVVMAMYYQYENDFDLASAELDKAFALNPNSADGLAIATWILTRSGQPQRALDGIERAIRLNPHHPDWYWGALRDAYFHEQRFEDAIAAIKKRSVAGGKWDAIFGALSYAQLSHDKEAARYSGQLLEEYPDFSAEKWLSETGTYARDVELNLFLDSVEKAGLPLCATEAQLEKYPDMKRLKQCEAERASG